MCVYMYVLRATLQNTVLKYIIFAFTKKSICFLINLHNIKLKSLACTLQLRVESIQLL